MTCYHNWSRQVPALDWLVHFCVYSLLVHPPLSPPTTQLSDVLLSFILYWLCLKYASIALWVWILKLYMWHYGIDYFPSFRLFCFSPQAQSAGSVILLCSHIIILGYARSRSCSRNPFSASHLHSPLPFLPLACLNVPCLYACFCKTCVIALCVSISNFCKWYCSVILDLPVLLCAHLGHCL